MFTYLSRRIIAQSSRCLTILPREAQMAEPYSRNFTHYITGRRDFSSNSAAYDGDGKTTVRVLNDEEQHLNLVNTYSANGFRLHNNLFIYGSILLFPTNVFSWNVKRAEDITMESLLLFDIIVPKAKIIIIGYGQYGEEYDATIPIKLKRKGISCEMLATPNAITTYNYLVHDSVHVAGAFIPVLEDVKMTTRDSYFIHGERQIEGSPEYFPKIQPGERINPEEEKKTYEKTAGKPDSSKKRYDDD